MPYAMCHMRVFCCESKSIYNNAVCVSFPSKQIIGQTHSVFKQQGYIYVYVMAVSLLSPFLLFCLIFFFLNVSLPPSLSFYAFCDARLGDSTALFVVVVVVVPFPFPVGEVIMEGVLVIPPPTFN
jgi:hypothetical protein